MPYVKRDDAGRIVGVLLVPDAHAPEFLPDGNVQLSAFVEALALRDDFARLDGDFVRVIEDLIEVLISRHVITITDLPERAQAKLFSRKAYRERTAMKSLQLLPDAQGGEGVFIDHPAA